jgi:hypothetical protein
VPLGIKVYMISYSCLSVLALAAALIRCRTLSLCRPNYWSFLFRPWKLATLVVLTLAITLPAPYMNISSWDVSICLGQSALSFLLAPWAVAVLVRAGRARKPSLESLLALCALLAVSCWGVEIYILIRDGGSYMRDWNYNYLASPPSFIGVGLLWNVERRGEDYSFAFLRSEWPEEPAPAA